jgi:hypothetical protein
MFRFSVIIGFVYNLQKICTQLDLGSINTQRMDNLNFSVICRAPPGKLQKKHRTIVE